MNWPIQFVSSLLLSLTVLLDVSSQKKPNVLLLTADDLGWDSLGCMGNVLPGLSPNLDRLAAEGLLIKRAYVVSPICGPSRQALYTGLYPQSSGFMGHGVQPPKWWKNQKREVPGQSITSLLMESGYLTGIIGKHGSDWCRYSLPPVGKNHETGMGRDPKKYMEFTQRFLAQAKREGKPFFLAANPHDPHRYWARHHDETAEWIRAMMGDKWKALPNGKPYPEPSSNFDSKECPVPTPYAKSPRVQKILATYYNSVNRMDEVVGGILKTLEKSGMAKNTLVFFLSDHGMAWDLSKWSLYPSGVRTPLIVRWPEKIDPGKVDEQSIVSIVDIAPTIAHLCNLPPMEKTDGQSFHSLLTGNSADWKRSQAFSCFNYMNNLREIDDSLVSFSKDLPEKIDQYRPSRALNDKRFCYVWNGWADGFNSLPKSMLGEYHWILSDSKNISTGFYADKKQATKTFIEFRCPEELYDLKHDPGCLHNLVEEFTHEDRLFQFRKQMRELLEDSNDHELPNFLDFINNQRKKP